MWLLIFAGGSLGHINNSGGGNKTLNIYYPNSDGEYQWTYAKELSKDMAYEDNISVDIYNTTTVKIEYDGSYSAVGYEMSDIYLVK